jgi:hypothetical protein
MNYQRKRRGWERALKKFNAANPPTSGLRILELPFETRLEMVKNQERHAATAVQDQRNSMLAGRECGRLMAWKQISTAVVPIWACLCACGRPTEAAAHRLLAGLVKDCGCLEKEAARIKRHRKAQKSKQRAKEARADLKRLRALLKLRKRKPPYKYWKVHGVAA